jgi:hypothetical protein
VDAAAAPDAVVALAVAAAGVRPPVPVVVAVPDAAAVPGARSAAQAAAAELHEVAARAVLPGELGVAEPLAGFAAEASGPPGLALALLVRVWTAAQRTPVF